MIGLDTNVLARHLVQDDPGMPDPSCYAVRNDNLLVRGRGMMGEKGQVSLIGEMKERDIRPILTRIVQVIRRYLPAESHRILLFGSWATLEAAPTSDIDIAIEGATAVDSTVMSEIHEEID